MVKVKYELLFSFVLYIVNSKAFTYLFMNRF